MTLTQLFLAALDREAHSTRRASRRRLARVNISSRYRSTVPAIDGPLADDQRFA